MAVAGVLEAQAPARRAIEYADLAPGVRQWLQREHPQAASDAASFDAYIHLLGERDRERRAEGEGEQLVYFVLQSTRFTEDPPIEPALSAKAFFAKLTPEERQRLLHDRTVVPPPARLPADAARRVRAFLNARPGEIAGWRAGPFGQLLRDRPSASAFSDLYAEYARAMRFLYQKEFPRESDAPGLASLYQERGYSTDTAFEANFPVYLGLGVLKGFSTFSSGSSGESLNRVLIVGPGLDLAPRTALVDLWPPQSYQPFAVADGLLALGLADRARLTIHAVDINDAVVRYFERVRQRQVTELSVLSGIGGTPGRPLMDGYRQYFQDFGTRIGEPSDQAPPAGLQGRLFKSIRIDEALARRLRADRLDIVTERYRSAPNYDLVVVTNVFTYFGDTELALALANIASMLRDGGYLVHNETRPVLAGLADTQGLKPVHLRSVLIAAPARTRASAGATEPAGSLYDTLWIHRKTPKQS